MKEDYFRNIPGLSEEQVSETAYLVKTRGYALVPDFYSDAICAQLTSPLESAIETYQPVDISERSALDRYHIHDLMNRDFIYCQFLEDPRLQQLLSPLLGDHWIMYAFTSSSLPPGKGNYGSRIHNDCPRFSPGYIFNVGLIWLLDDFTADNGGTYVLPASQHIEAPPSEALFNRNSMQLEAKRGSLLVFDARLYHRAGENHTDNWRHSLTLNACRSYMKQRMDWVRFIRSDFSDRLNDQARRILGFDTRLPTRMEELFLPESERLYKANQG